MSKIFAGLAFSSMLFALCLSVNAQDPPRVSKIGWLGARPASIATGLKLLTRELAGLGYVEGKNITFQARYAEGKYDRLPALIDELVRLKVDVLMTPSDIETSAAKNATKLFPRRFFRGVRSCCGWAGSQPGPAWRKHHRIHIHLGRVVGQTTGDSQGNRSQALPSCGAVESTESRLSATMGRKPIGGTGTGCAALFHGGEDAFNAATKAGSAALVVTHDSLANANSKQILKLAAINRLPAIYFREILSRSVA
jgi:hypothetical protein